MGHLSDLLVFIAVLTATLFAHYLRSRRYRHPGSALSYPPGPNPTSMPTYDPWVQYQSWGREYGKLVYIHDKNILIVNDSQTAVDLLERRARIYSDRPLTPLMKLAGMDLLLSLKPYSPEWRRDRKLFLQVFRRAAIGRFFPAQYSLVHEFLRNLITSPEDFTQHTTALSQRLVYASLYGLDVSPQDPLARKTVEMLVSLGRLLTPGSYPWAERFPWLYYMPLWFPGSGIKQNAEQTLKVIKEVDTLPFDMAMDNLKKGLGTSVIAELAVKSEGNSSEVEAIKSMGTISLAAAADTTMSSISSFLLSMALYPDVQKKGQEELDRIVGRNRLPTFEDRPSLPYIEAIYCEVMRMHPPLPLGLWHSSVEDDFYNGSHIPKGCVVVPNIWAMNRDPDVYSDPDEFIPERFLDSPKGPFGNLNDIYAFGFGRRVCAGRHMADNTVWLAIASFLATMTIGKMKDSGGDEIDIPGEFTNSFFRHPKPYKCSIKPRAPYAKELILATHESE